MNHYLPEGRYLLTEENVRSLSSPLALRNAMDNKQILEGRVILCNASHDLVVQCGKYTGLIPRSETALGIEGGNIKEIAILSRVGKPICFVIQMLDFSGPVPKIILSRRQAQISAMNYFVDHLLPGMIIPATVTHLAPFGAFVDIGCGIISMIGIENISISRITHPADRFFIGDHIYAVVLGIEKERNRILLTHKELLGTWSENIARFSQGETVPGIVRGIKEYGAFVELAPNLSGLAEFHPNLSKNTQVSVYLKAIVPERMKIKLLVIDRIDEQVTPQPLVYFMTEGRLKRWRYSPEVCTRPAIETIFQI